MLPIFLKRTRSWSKDLKSGADTRRYSVKLVREWSLNGENCRIYTNGSQIDPTVYKRARGLERCSTDANFIWEFEGHSFLLVQTTSLPLAWDFHLFIDGVDVETAHSPWMFWRRRGWLLIYFGVIKIMMGMALESLRYLQDPVAALVVMMIVGRVVILLGLFQVFEGVTMILSRYPTNGLPVETV